MKITLLILSFSLWLSSTLVAQKWSFEFHGGDAYNVPLPLIIKQNGFPNIKVSSAKYASRAFVKPVYWDWRFSRWHNNRSWEFEAVHHKLYLENPPEGVQKFHISHGFNMLTVNRGFKKDNFHFRYGLGVVLTHPESTIRNQKFDETEGIFNMGYYISGPSLNLAFGYRYYPVKRLFLNLEGKTSYSWVSVPIYNGNASLSNLSFQVILGIGFDFISRDNSPERN